MLGRREGVTPEGSRLLPAEVHGVRMMSMGLLLQPGRDTLVWRGPMVAKAVSQMLTDVDWGELDYLIFDLPPGTGDAPLTLAQQVPLAGGVVVCTPQEVAIRTALKSVTMFRTLRVPVLGVVENMSFFLCPNCGHRSEIFAHGGAERACQEEGLPFLGAIPLDETVRASGDAGEPVALHGETAQGEIFRSIARRLVTELRHSAEAAPPTITVN
jgi:ATP-binding protein involved in chromosome partitioning